MKLKLTKLDKQHISALLLPSWISGTFMILAGLFLTIGTIVAFNVNNSPLQQQLVAWQQSQPKKALTTPDQVLEENDGPTLQGSWPLILVWSFVGLATYTVAASIMHTVSDAYALRRSLGYVNANPRSLLETAAERLFLRLLSAAIFAVLLSLFITRAVPYAISASHATAADILSPEGVLYAFLSFSIIVVCIHAQTVFLRLAAGKPRIFSNY